MQRGEQFPLNVPVNTQTGERTIGEMIAAGPLVIAFHRLWCPFCQQAARDLAATSDELTALGARVVIVYREDLETVAASCHERGLSCLACISDPGHRLETAAEVRRFSIARYGMYSPRRLLVALRSGSRIRAMGSNVLQGRGTYVLDTSGRVLYVHQARNAADIPRIADVVAAVRSITATAVD